MIAHHLERIIVVPRNGYANRLQAWASAAILGAELDVPVSVVWEPQPIAPATADVLFAPHRITMSFIDASDLASLLGHSHEDLPRYLHTDPERRIVSLAGHDRGEQSFMAQLGWVLADECEPHTLVIIAGGHFHLPGATTFERQRQLFYEHLEWSNPIAERVSLLLADREPYLAVHLRGTDRSRTAPTTRALRSALADLRSATGLDRLFVAADTPETRRHWFDIAINDGFHPWSSEGEQFDRTVAAAGLDAIVDWVLLGHARALAYSAESSFAHEAAVASGNLADSIALSASPSLQRLRGARDDLTALAGYPMRRLRGRA